MEAFERLAKVEGKVALGKYVGLGALLFVVLALGCSGGGEKPKADKSEPQTAPISPAPTKNPEANGAQPAKQAGATPVISPAERRASEEKEAQQAQQPPPSLGITINEFCQRFNKNSEHVKSKLRIMNLTVAPGEAQNSVKHIFNENLYLTGKVNNADGSVVEVCLVGVLNGSLATAVDLNLGIGTIISAVAPDQSPEMRDSLLDVLGINKITSGIYNLENQVTKNGRTYWVKSSRKAGLRFGVRSAKQ